MIDCIELIDLPARVIREGEPARERRERRQTRPRRQMDRFMETAAPVRSYGAGDGAPAADPPLAAAH